MWPFVWRFYARQLHYNVRLSGLVMFLMYNGYSSIDIVFVFVEVIGALSPLGSWTCLIFFTRKRKTGSFKDDDAVFAREWLTRLICQSGAAGRGSGGEELISGGELCQAAAPSSLWVFLSPSLTQCNLFSFPSFHFVIHLIELPCLCVFFLALTCNWSAR